MIDIPKEFLAYMYTHEHAQRRETLEVNEEVVAEKNYLHGLDNMK